MQWLKLVGSVIFVAFQGLWRRTFGGWRDPWGILKKIDNVISVRFLLEIIEVIVITGVMMLVSGCSWLSGLLIGLVLTIAFWLPGHGPWFDMGHDRNPDEEMIKRYEEVWWDKILKKLFAKDQWYGAFYDFVGLMFRYTLPCLLLVPFFGGSILLMGIGVAIIYGVCWSAKDGSSEEWTLGATDLAEIIAGCWTGLFLILDPVWFDIGQMILNKF